MNLQKNIISKEHSSFVGYLLVIGEHRNEDAVNIYTQ